MFFLHHVFWLSCTVNLHDTDCYHISSLYTYILPGLVTHSITRLLCTVNLHDLDCYHTSSPFLNLVRVYCFSTGSGNNTANQRKDIQHCILLFHNLPNVEVTVADGHHEDMAKKDAVVECKNISTKTFHVLS